MNSPHHIRKQTFEVEVVSEELALALQARLGDFNRQNFWPVLERVFDEFSVPGRRIKISRLELDLGDVPFDRFDEVATERFNSELRRALEEALRKQQENPTSEIYSQTESASRFELLDYYLLHGTLPFWAPRQSHFSFEQLIAELAAEDPAALVRVIKQHAFHRSAIERLVLQLTETMLRQLLHLLEPQHAALIIAYMTDLKLVHRVEPVIAADEKEFARSVWLLVLTYVLQESGSQFNRKVFVKRLLEGLAMAEGVTYSQIVRVVSAGLPKTMKHLSLTSSLPAIISELAHELSPNEELSQSNIQAELAQLESYLRSHNSEMNRSEAAALLRGLAAARTRELISQFALRFQSRLPGLVECLLHEFSTEEVLSIVAPEQKQFLIDFANSFSSAGTQAGDAFWNATLEYVLSDSSHRWNRKAMIEQIVADVAGRVRLSPDKLAENVAATLAQKGKPIEASLVREVVASHSLTYRWPLVFSRYDRGEVIRYYLHHGLLPWTALLLDPGMTAESVFASLAGLPRSLLHALLTQETHEKQLQTLRRLVRIMSEENLMQLLGALMPEAKEADSPFQSALRSLASNVEDRQSLYVYLLAAILEGKPLDLEEFAASAVSQPVTDQPDAVTDPDEWDAEMIESVLVNRLRFSETWEHLSPIALLELLAAKHPEDARHFFRELRDTPDLMAALAKFCTSADLDRVFALVPHADAVQDDVFVLLRRREREEQHTQSESGMSGPQLSASALQQRLIETLEEMPPDTQNFISEQAQNSLVREQWAKSLPESILARLVSVLEPRRFRSLLDAAEVLASAWLEAVPTGVGPLAQRQIFWSFLLKFLSHTAEADRSVDRLVAAFFHDFAARYKATSPDRPHIIDTGNKLLECALRLAGNTGQAGLQAVLRRERKSLLAFWEHSTTNLKDDDDQQKPSADRRKSARPVGTQTAFSMEVDNMDQSEGEPIYINNAGLVLTGPFLPHLFENLKLLTTDENNRTRLHPPEALSRAVHLLQYLVDGRTSAPEPSLALNKLLCGVSPSVPVDRGIEITDRERELCEQLLRAMIANWPAISNTSIAGLQETFLRREGKIEQKNHEWKVRVQRKTVDVLVDQIPWTTSVILHRWMPHPIYVDW